MPTYVHFNAAAGRKNPWADIYDPARPPPFKSLMEVGREDGATPVVGMLSWLPCSR